MSLRLTIIIPSSSLLFLLSLTLRIKIEIVAAWHHIDDPPPSYGTRHEPYASGARRSGEESIQADETDETTQQRRGKRGEDDRPRRRLLAPFDAVDEPTVVMNDG